MAVFEDERVLVTGGAGFIGSHIVDRLMIEGANVRVLDDMSDGSKSNILQWMENPKFELIKGDIRDQDAVNASLGDINIVFHQAAKVSIPLSVKQPHLVLSVNTMGTAILLEACRKLDVKKVVVASSSSVYGDSVALPKVETMATEPISPYAVSKLGAEHMAIAYYHTFGLNTTALRYFNVYGPRQRGGAYAGVISLFIKNALAGEALIIEGDGLQTRDFTYVKDVAESNKLAALCKDAKGNVYNVGSGVQTTIEEIASQILANTGSKSEKTYAPPRVGDVRHSLASLEKAKRDLCYEPKTKIKEGIKDTVEWVKSQTY